MKTPILNKFFVIGKGFIYPKHKEAIEAVGGTIVDNIKMADWVVILTPNYLHFKMVKDAVNMGKNVLCEKPLVLTTKECIELMFLMRRQNKKIFTVAQLRYHPLVTTIPRQKDNQIKITVNVHRDEEYWKSWKGQVDKSGGLLFNLGIHYLDLIVYIFGKPTGFMRRFRDKKENNGWFGGDGYTCEYTIACVAEKDKNYRSFKINDREYDFNTDKNLFIPLYQDLLNGKGVAPDEILDTIKLVENLK